MAEREPVAAESLRVGGGPVTPWREGRRRLERADLYWLATTQEDCRPHVVPVLALWLDGALCFVAGRATRKARNLATRPYCVLTADCHGAHLVVEGEAEKMRDDAALREVAEAYAAKYDWSVSVRDGVLHGDGAPTAGPPPYQVHRVAPAKVLGFGADESFHPTRWRFEGGAGTSAASQLSQAASARWTD